MAKLILSMLPKHMRTRRWIKSEITYQEHKSIHTRTDCFYCGRTSRGGTCAECWRGVLREKEAKEDTDA